MKKYYLIFLCIALTGCKGCLQKYYGVNSLGYVNIVFSNCKLRNTYLQSYIDSVTNKGMTIPDSIRFKFFANGTPSSNERIIYFKNEPEEWYVVSFDVSQPWIEFIYNHRIDPINMIRERKLLGQQEIFRIQNRFNNEFIKSAEDFGKKNNIPDSVMYNK